LAAGAVGSGIGALAVITQCGIARITAGLVAITALCLPLVLVEITGAGLIRLCPVSLSRLAGLVLAEITGAGLVCLVPVSLPRLILRVHTRLIRTTFLGAILIARRLIVFLIEPRGRGIASEVIGAVIGVIRAGPVHVIGVNIIPVDVIAIEIILATLFRLMSLVLMLLRLILFALMLLRFILLL
jgi:hypothetical protein